MEPLRAALERRLACLDALAAPDGRTHGPPAAAAWDGRDVLRRVVGEGIEMTPAGRGWSEAERRLMGVLFRAVRIRRGQCYANAQRVLLASNRLEVLLHHTLVYCEGYARLPHLGAPFAHAWCLLNARVWDPTLDRLGVPVSYVGLSLPTDFVFFTLHRRGRLGPVLSEWCAPVEVRRRTIGRSLRVFMGARRTAAAR